jgi:hypothetical protein
MTRAAQDLRLLIPGRTACCAPRNDDGRTLHFVFNPTAGGGPVATSGAGGAGASMRQP